MLVGRRSKVKGKTFERRIAQVMRRIYDLPELVEAIELADASTRKKFMKSSHVRRGEQGQGAHEPDLVTPDRYWMELQNASGSNHNPLAKLAQAERDAKCGFVPVSICHKTGSRSTEVCLRAGALYNTLPLSVLQNIPIRFDLDDFVRILEYEKRNTERAERGLADLQTVG